MAIRTIHDECARLASDPQSEGGALASVVRRRGSLPMSATAKMLVTAGGARIGTVGGGCLEAEITERALEVAASRVPAVSEHSLNAELAGDYGLTCGGTATIFIEPVFPDATLAAVYAACVETLARGQRGVMATALHWPSGIEKLLLAPGRVVGSGSDALRAAAAALDEGADAPAIDARAVVEPVVGPPRVVIFGGGHVGVRLAQLAAFAGWRVTVVDDRPEFADPSRFPSAERTVVCHFHDLSSAPLGLDPSCYVVVATRGHQHDAVIIEQVAQLPLKFLGLLGSRRKLALMRQLLVSRGLAPEQFDRIRSPVGLDIGADTPEEIGVSVVAEMITVRRRME